MKKLRDKAVKLKATGADRELAKRQNPGASTEEIDVLAAYRGVARSIACETKNTIRALNVVTAGVPSQTLKRWAEELLKAA